MRQEKIIMTPETTLALDKVRAKLQECRNIIDNHLYYSADAPNVPDADEKFCRKVYDAVCKAMDLL